MCEFFSCIATKDGKVLFTEEDSHETTIKRAKLKDDGESIVRLEYDGAHLKADQQIIPEWFEHAYIKIERRVKKAYAVVAPAREEYKSS